MKKQLFVFGALLFFVTSHCLAQTSKVIIDNDKVRVTEYLSKPGEPVCGKGMHTHSDHLTILLTDAKVKTSYSNGESQIESFAAGKRLYTVNKGGKMEHFSNDGAFWAKAEEHEVSNVADQPLRFFIVEIK